MKTTTLHVRSNGGIGNDCEYCKKDLSSALMLQECPARAVAPVSCYAQEMRHTFRTYSGKYFNLAAPTPAMVCLEDVAHALAYSSRYNGHLPRFYSIAQHCVHVAQALAVDEQAIADYPVASGDWQVLMSLALLHDAAEAYVGDVVSPLKGLLPEYRKIEDRVHLAVLQHFRLPEDWQAAQGLIHAADLRVFAGEVCTLRGWGEADFEPMRNPELFGQRFEGIAPPWTPGAAKRHFLKVAHKLGLR